MFTHSPLVRWLEQVGAFELDRTDFTFRPVTENDFVKNRAVGEGYTATAKTPSPEQSSALAMHGDTFTVDDTHIADAERGLYDLDVWLNRMLAKRARAFARGYEQKLMQGDPGVTANDVTGLATLLDGSTNLPGLGYTATYGAEAVAGGQSLDLSSEANFDPFIEMLEERLAEVDNPNGILVGPELGARMTTIARRKHMLGEARNLFGQPIPAFNGIPLIRLNKGSISTTEANANASATDCTSLYIVSAGEMMASVVTNSGLVFYDQGEREDIMSNQMKYEVRSQPKVEEQNVIERVMHIKL